MYIARLPHPSESYQQLNHCVRSCETFLYANGVCFLFLYSWACALLVSLHSGITGAASYQHAWSPAIKRLMWRWKPVLVRGCPLLWRLGQMTTSACVSRSSKFVANNTILCTRGAKADGTDSSRLERVIDRGRSRGSVLYLFKGRYKRAQPNQ